GVLRARGAMRLAERRSVVPRARAGPRTRNVLARLAASGFAMTDLDAGVVGCGPGPFTGLRVGMATAAAYGHALDIPVHGVCSLDAIGGQTTRGAVGGTHARGGGGYLARYRRRGRGGGPGGRGAARVRSRAGAGGGRPEPARWAGRRRPHPPYPTPAGLVAAVADWSRHPTALVPLYLRRPDAKTLAERSDDAGRDGLRRSGAIGVSGAIQNIVF